MEKWYQWQDANLILRVRVQPRASRDEIVGPQEDNTLKVRITAPPVDGKANQHLVKFLAKAFGVAKSNIELLRGENGRNKQLSITSPTRVPKAAGIEPCPSA